MKINENESKIIQLYNEGYNSVQIAEILNKPKHYYKTVLNVLKRNKLKPRCNRLKLNENDIKNICLMYESGLTQIEILKHYKIIKSEKTINDILKRNNIQLRRVGHKEIVKNHNYFENIDTEKKAYFLGLLMADGCITKSKNKEYEVINIGLKLEDKYLIEIFEEEIGFSGKPYIETKEMKNKHSDFVSSDGFYSIRFLDRKMVVDLSKYGIIPQKTGKEQILDTIPEELMPHFIRGFFDGDGSVFMSKNYLHFSIYSSKKMCEDILKKLNLEYRKIYKTVGVYFISFQKKEIIEQFYKYIYTDCSIYMKRKKKIFDSFLKK